MTRVTRAAAIAAICAAAHAAMAAAPPPDDLAVTRRLAEAGAAQLALDRVERLQPRDRTAPQWQEWEALRCGALGALGRHAVVLEIAAAIPADARAEPLVACYTHAARAALAMERYPQARRHAARALWQLNPAAGDVQMLRRLVIDSYAGEGRGEDAYRAILRYQQDHQPLPRGVLGRFVSALLDLGMEKEALNSLSQLDDTQPAKLRLRLRAGLVSREAAIAQARAAFAKGGDSEYWRVVLDAAGADASPLRVTAHEQLLNGRDDFTLETPAAARRLWAEYLATAVNAGNAAGLLVGDDASWADHAGRRLSSEPAMARALFAHLTQRARTAAARHNAQLQLLHAYQDARLEGVALHVFGALFGDVDALDTQVRYRLGAMAESRGDPVAAASYWRDLPPPASMDAGEWLVRVSRLRWRAGSEDTGVDRLTRHYSAQRSVAPAAMQQAIAYAEQLAESGRFKSAASLLEALVPHAPPAHVRALLLSLGHAREGAAEFKPAAEAYLRSALAAPGVPDAQAAQARLRAGTALARAGYARDARMQFVWIIDNVKDEALVHAARSGLARLQL